MSIKYVEMKCINLTLGKVALYCLTMYLMQVTDGTMVFRSQFNVHPLFMSSAAAVVASTNNEHHLTGKNVSTCYYYERDIKWRVHSTYRIICPVERII